MNSYDRFYTEKLYPLQNGILSIVKNSKAPFYLTGGTALGRHYFNHRYSDDLDLFVNQDALFAEYVSDFYKSLKINQEKIGYSIDTNRILSLENYAQFYIFGNQSQIELKIDLVNDIEYHVGNIEISSDFGRIDNWQNILSNKLAALPRLETKDIADIWVICQNKSFQWKDIVFEAKQKDAGVHVAMLTKIISSCPIHLLMAVKWAIQVDPIKIENNLRTIATDILKGEENTLCYRE